MPQQSRWMTVKNPLPDMAEAAPSVAYFWIRDYLFRSLVAHRSRWRRTTAVKFGRRNESIKIPKVNEGVPADNVVLYLVTPKERRIRNPREARAALDVLQASITSTNTVLKQLQEGVTIKPKRGKMLAIPLIPPEKKSRGRLTPKRVRQVRPRNPLIARKSKKSGTLLLFERKRRRGPERRRLRRTKTGKIAKSQPRVKYDVLIPRWALVPKVTVEPKLAFYETWASLKADRAKKFARACDRIARDIANGVAS